MRIQFVIGTNIENTIDIDVAEIPTDEQTKSIEDDIYNAMEEWEENNGDFSDFDYYMCCFEAVQKHVQIGENRIVKTKRISFIRLLQS